VLTDPSQLLFHQEDLADLFLYHHHYLEQLLDLDLDLDPVAVVAAED
jgi:hypothetical protein